MQGSGEGAVNMSDKVSAVWDLLNLVPSTVMANTWPTADGGLLNERSSKKRTQESIYLRTQ